MKSAGELANFRQKILNLMSDELDDLIDGNSRIAREISSISVCSLRVRDVSSHSKTFHAVSRFENPVNASPYPYFTITFEERMGNTKFDVGLGFVFQNKKFLGFRPVGCHGCADEEYCSKQKDELLEEDFQFLSNDVMQAMKRYTGLWSPVLADFALSFGTEYMYEEVPFILNQIFHTWTDLPEELSSQYSG